MQLYAQNRCVWASCCGPTLLETVFLDAAISRRWRFDASAFVMRAVAPSRRGARSTPTANCCKLTALHDACTRSAAPPQRALQRAISDPWHRAPGRSGGCHQPLCLSRRLFGSRRLRVVRGLCAGYKRPRSSQPAGTGVVDLHLMAHFAAKMVQSTTRARLRHVTVVLGCASVAGNDPDVTVKPLRPTGSRDGARKRSSPGAGRRRSVPAVRSRGCPERALQDDPLGRLPAGVSNSRRWLLGIIEAEAGFGSTFHLDDSPVSLHSECPVRDGEAIDVTKVLFACCIGIHGE